MVSPRDSSYRKSCLFLSLFSSIFHWWPVSYLFICLLVFIIIMKSFIETYFICSILSKYFLTDSQIAPLLASGSQFSKCLLNPFYLILIIFNGFWLCGMTKSSKFILNNFCPRPGISHFPKDHWFLLMGGNLRDHSLGAWSLHCYWVFWVPEQWTKWQALLVKVMFCKGKQQQKKNSEICLLDYSKLWWRKIKQVRGLKTVEEQWCQL